MSPDKKPFGFRDFFDILVVNAKVIFAIILFLLVFLSIFFGYYTLLLIAFLIIFITYIVIDAIKRHKENKEDSE